jgi:CheY-like chemotaxis protein
MTKPRVLVVDDDEGIVEFVCAALADEGYRAEPAVDGRQALEAVAQAPPGLILLDMRMPVMDGWEFMATYQRMPGTHAPVVVMTAARDAAAIAAEIHTDGYLAKPFSLDELLMTADRYATRQRAS